MVLLAELSKALSELALVLSLLAPSSTMSLVLGTTPSIETPPVPQILQKIAYCESGDNHFNKDGRVIRGKINNLDIGRYQINLLYWNDKAKELGLDIFDEDDNETMATWIYDNHGTKPWKWSKKCWDKK